MNDSDECRRLLLAAAREESSSLLSALPKSSFMNGFESHSIEHAYQASLATSRARGCRYITCACFCWVSLRIWNACTGDAIKPVDFYFTCITATILMTTIVTSATLFYTHRRAVECRMLLKYVCYGAAATCQFALVSSIQGAFSSVPTMRSQTYHGFRVGMLSCLLLFGCPIVYLALLRLRLWQCVAHSTVGLALLLANDEIASPVQVISIYLVFVHTVCAIHDELQSAFEAQLQTLAAAQSLSTKLTGLELNLAQQEAEHRVRESVLRTLSHDLKGTSVNAIQELDNVREAVACIIDQTILQNATDGLDRAAAECVHLQRSVRSLQMQHDIARGTYVVCARPVAVRGLLETLCSRYPKLDLQIAEDLQQLKCDADGVYHVLHNAG